MDNNNNTGYYNAGNYNTGYYNTGYRNTGNYNTGNYNAGNYNTGNYNTGYRNAGDYNTGNSNTGNYNTGNYNTGNYNTGYFNIDEPRVRIFWKETDMKKEDIVFPDWLDFNLTEWVYESDMTEEQKNDSDNQYYKTTWWILVEYDYKEAFQKSYNKATIEEQLKVKELPNFDSDIFFEISWIRIDEEEKTELTLDEIAKKFWVDVNSLKIKK